MSCESINKQLCFKFQSIQTAVSYLTLPSPLTRSLVAVLPLQLQCLILCYSQIKVNLGSCLTQKSPLRTAQRESKTDLAECLSECVQYRYNVLLLPKVHLSTVAASEPKRKKKKCGVRESKQ